jgi:hypothetical protein
MQRYGRLERLRARVIENDALRARGRGAQRRGEYGECEAQKKMRDAAVAWHLHGALIV